MKLDNVYVVACASWLPSLLTVSDALAAGLCEPALATALGMHSVAVSQGESGPEMAAQAARIALERAGQPRGEIDLLLHASFYYQGQDLWAPASYVHRVAVGNSCPAIQINQVSNGGMAAIELASAYLLAGSGRSAALLTSGDRFCPPGFDRWHSDTGTVYADGGTAMMLSVRGGFARIRSISTVSRSELEGLHRGDEPFGPAPFSHRSTVEMDDYKDAFFRQAGRSFILTQVSAGQREALKLALTDAEVELADLDWFVLPHMGRRRLNTGFLPLLGAEPEQTTWPWGRTVGHLGAGDQFAGFDHLVSTGQAAPGTKGLLFGVGAGFSWSCAVIEVLARPGWVEAQPS
jgi:3-oxoacyl-[acyl-carrier-protein] synthase III